MTGVVARRAGGAALVVAVVGVYVAGAQLAAGHPLLGHVWADAGWTLTSLVAAVACYLTARRATLPHRRAAWRWFGAGAASWFVGMLIWSVHELALGRLTPFPSTADLAFVGLAPCFVLGCLRYVADRASPALTLKQLGDLAMIGCVLVVVAALTLYGPVVASADDTVYVLAALAYPVLNGSALVFGLVCWWQHVGTGQRWVLGLLLAGMALQAFVTTLYAESLLGRRYHAGAWMDPLWIAAFAMVTWAAREELREPAPVDTAVRPDDAPVFDAVLPAFAVLVAVAVALAFRDRLVGPTVAVTGSAGLGLAVALGVRLAASQRLERSLHARVRADDERARRLQVGLLQAQRLQSIGALASGVAHDYKNLLQVMIAGLTLARLRIDRGQPAAAELDDIEHAMWRATELSARLLDLARQGPSRATRIDPAPLVASVAGLLAKALPAGIQLEVMPTPPDLPAIEVDAAGLEHALLGLGLNARDALKPTGGTIRIAIERRAVPGIAGRAVVLRVDDDGPGIPPAILARVFEPFFTTKPPGEGTGLGLATVEALAAEHGGTVRASNRAGGGACFELAFPAAPPAPAAPSRAGATVAARDVHTGGGTVLVIDSGEASGLAVTGALERSGYAAIVVGTRAAALAAAAAPGPRIAVVIADASSGMVGSDALAALRAAGCLAPVVLVAAADATPSGDYAAIVHKPLDPHGLVDAVRAAIQPMPAASDLAERR